MEFLDEFESRPRLMFQAKQFPRSTGPDSTHSSLSSIHKPTLFVCVSFSLLIVYIAIVYIDFEPWKSLLLWFSLSLIVGPFAPHSLTAGDIRVGLGYSLREIPKTDDLGSDERFHRKSTKPVRKPSDDPGRYDGFLEKSNLVNESVIDSDRNEANSSGSLTEENWEETEWNRTDEELLRKLLGKHPVGKPGRWEAIAEGFQGKHKVGSVIMKAKEMGVRKASDQDSFKKFLEDRKPVDKTVLAEGNKTDAVIETNNTNVEEGRTDSGWSAGEDLALLNALKAFPKDVAMRWEKIAASLPGKSKSACIKRVSELKRDFRSSKSSTGQAS